MMWFFAILIVLALGGVAVVASGRGTPMEPAYDDRPDALVPADGLVTADDLRRVRFSLAFRGYRMSEVDALLERLAEEKEAGERVGRELEASDRPSASTSWSDSESDPDGDAGDFGDPGDLGDPGDPGDRGEDLADESTGSQPA